MMTPSGRASLGAVVIEQPIEGVVGLKVQHVDCADEPRSFHWVVGSQPVLLGSRPKPKSTRLTATGFETSSGWPFLVRNKKLAISEGSHQSGGSASSIC